jgi:hypothetical protein
MNGYVGEYDPITPLIFAEDHFEFEKQPVGDGEWIEGWFVNVGESFEELRTPVAVSHVLSLNQIYPNPFNPTTTFSFSLPEAQQVTLQIYNLRGQLIGTLIDGTREAGVHDLTFDASHLSSGIYVYRMTAGDQVLSGKMTLVK